MTNLNAIPDKPRRTRRQWADQGMARAMTKAQKLHDNGEHEKAYRHVLKAVIIGDSWLAGTHPKIAKASDAYQVGAFWPERRRENER